MRTSARSGPMSRSPMASGRERDVFPRRREQDRTLRMRLGRQGSELARRLRQKAGPHAAEAVGPERAPVDRHGKARPKQAQRDRRPRGVEVARPERGGPPPPPPGARGGTPPPPPPVPPQQPL